LLKEDKLSYAYRIFSAISKMFLEVILRALLSHPELPVPVDTITPDDLNLPKSSPSTFILYDELYEAFFSARNISLRTNLFIVRISFSTMTWSLS